MEDSDGNITEVNDTSLTSLGDNYFLFEKLKVDRWSQMGFDILGETSNARTRGVSLSKDTNRLAIGAYGKSGNVRVYEWRQYTSSEVNDYYYISQIQSSFQDKPLIITGGSDPVVGQNYWMQVGFDINHENGFDNSGWCLSLSADGNRVAIGGYGNDGQETSSTDNRGHIRIYEWRQYTSDDEYSGTYHYSYFSTEQDSTQTKPIIINSPGGAAPVVGNYYWTQLGSDIDGATSGDQFGFAISLSNDGTRVAASSSQGYGYVKVYQYIDGSPGSWSQLGNVLTGATETDFGWSVSLSGNDGDKLAIGDISYDSGKGQVLIYENITQQNNSWGIIGPLFNGTNNNEKMGYDISLSDDGDRIAISTKNSSADGKVSRGHVSVYEWSNGTSWQQLGFNIDGEGQGDESGENISLSGDGKRVAITAKDARDALNGSGTPGHVRVYEWREYTQSDQDNDVYEYSTRKQYTYLPWNSYNKPIIITGSPPSASSAPIVNQKYWTQVGMDIDGQDDFEGLGDDVSLNRDGSIVAVSATYGPASTYTGKVRVYNLLSTTDYIVTLTRSLTNSIYTYDFLINGRNWSFSLTKGNTYRFILNIPDFDGQTNNGFRIVGTDNSYDLDWSSATGTPTNKDTYLVTDGLSHSDGTTGEEANSGKNFGVLTYTVPSVVEKTKQVGDFPSHFIVGPWSNDKYNTNSPAVYIHRIYYV